MSRLLNTRRSGQVTAGMMLLVVACPAVGAEFMVTSTANDGPGSLHQAILDANANPGANIIKFSIEDAIQTINLTSPLPAITYPVLIDGTTQPGFAGMPIVELNGASAGAGVDGLVITAGSSTVRGLVIDRFTGNGVVLRSGGGNLLEGNFIGLDTLGTLDLGNGGHGVYINGSSNNIIGGTTPGARNIISGNGGSGVNMDSVSTGNQVLGNYLGTDITGTLGRGNTGRGIYVTGSLANNNTIGGTSPEARNLISGNSGAGIMLENGPTGNHILGNFIGTNKLGTTKIGNDPGVRIRNAPSNTVGGTQAGAGNIISGSRGFGIQIDGGSENNSVEGNYIGLGPDGILKLGNSNNGVYVTGSSNNMIGGTASGARNIISGNGSSGVRIDASSAGNQVVGNFIGTTASGTTRVGNTNYGVRISDSSNNIIGGTGNGAGNLISGSTLDGVRIDGNASGNAVLTNSISQNGSLGIDLGPLDGVTPNDPWDADNGPNGLQNYPVLIRAVSDSTSTVIDGALYSQLNMRYRLDFFVNDVCDVSGYGEGQTFLGSTGVTTDDTGTARFTLSFEAHVPVGQVITATATDLSNNTSEFSRCVVVGPLSGNSGRDGDFNGDCLINQDDLNAFRSCVTGPAIPYDPAHLPSGCTLKPDVNGHIAADFDQDGDVDQNDFGAFQMRLGTTSVAQCGDHGIPDTACKACVCEPGYGGANCDQLMFQIVDFHSVQNFRMQNLSGSAPSYPEGSLILDGVPFYIPPGANNVWDSASATGPDPRSLDVNVGVFGVTEVHTLINTRWGQASPVAYCWLEFYGSAGSYFRKDLVGNIDVRDHLQNTWTNNVNGTTTINVVTIGSGQGNEARLDKQRIVLPPSFASETLVAIRLSDNGATNFQRAFLAGLTVGLPAQ